MGHTQLAGDDTGPDAMVGHLHDLVADVIRQGSPVDEDPTQLIDPALAKRGGHWRGKSRRETSGRSFGERGEQPKRRTPISHSSGRSVSYSLSTEIAPFGLPT